MQLQLLLIVFLLLKASVKPTGAFVPLACARQLELSGGSPVRCCPDNCGGPGRGRCQKVRPYPEREFLGLAPGSPQLRDDRLDWPGAFFSHLCSCRERRFGPACELCGFGWAGPECNRRDIRVRRNISRLSDVERRKLRDLMKLGRVASSGFALLIEDGWKPPGNQSGSGSDPLRKPRFLTGAPLHYYLVHVHFYAQRGTLAVPPDQCQGSRLYFNYNHQGNNFLPWHRYFLLIWERSLQALAASHLAWPDFSMPYWDWTDASTCEVCTEDLLGPLAGVQEYCASNLDWPNPCFGCHQAELHRRPLTRRWLPGGKFPSRSELKFVTSRPVYYRANDFACDSLLMALEGECGPNGFTPMYYMHNRLHALVNGSFSAGASSPNDPLFPVHHAQVDRILESWLSNYGHSKAALELPQLHKNRPGHGPESYLVGFIPLMKARDVLVPTEALGYSYDTLNV